MPWNKQSTMTKLCETDEEFDLYWKLAFGITLEVTESEIYAKTGCKARCKKFVYSHKMVANGNFPYGAVNDTVIFRLIHQGQVNIMI